MFFWGFVKRGWILFRELGCMSEVLALANCPQPDHKSRLQLSTFIEI